MQKPGCLCTIVVFSTKEIYLFNTNIYFMKPVLLMVLYGIKSQFYYFIDIVTIGKASLIQMTQSAARLLSQKAKDSSIIFFTENFTNMTSLQYIKYVYIKASNTIVHKTLTTPKKLFHGKIIW